MPKSRDYQRSKLYKAEREAFKACDDAGSTTIPMCQAYYDTLIKSAWFKRRWTIPRVVLSDGRGTRRPTGGMSGGIVRHARINLPKWGRVEWVMLHELAHCCVEQKYSYRATSWHGREFAKTYVELVEHCMGKALATELKAQFKAHRVKMRGSDGDHFARVKRRALITKGVIAAGPVPAAFAATVRSKVVSIADTAGIGAATRRDAHRRIIALQCEIEDKQQEIKMHLDTLQKLEAE